MNRITAGLCSAAALALSLLPALVLASPGGTDANGGHYEHATGLYHYHHGYPAHQHPGGICPYTEEVWELAVPERPPTLLEWEQQKHAGDDRAAIDDQTPENEDWKKTTKRKSGSSAALPLAAAAGGAALLGGAFAANRARQKNKKAFVPVNRADAVSTPPNPEPAAEPAAETVNPVRDPSMETTLPNTEKSARTVTPGAETPAAANAQPADLSPEAVIPEGTVIGRDGLPWEREAYERECAKPPMMPGTGEVATNFSEPRWGRLYSFCVDADGEEIHTLDCEMAFIQVNVADRTCPKLDCPVCRPVRPDLRWFEEYQKRKEAMKRAEPVK